MVSTRDLIRQCLNLALQRIFAGVNGIRHGGSEESIDAVRRQSSTWVTDRFTESADVPDRPHSSVSASGQQADAKKPTGRRSAQKYEIDKPNNEHQRTPLKIEGTQKHESDYRFRCFRCGCAQRPFKGRAKSRYMGFTVKMFDCVGSE